LFTSSRLTHQKDCVQYDSPAVRVVIMYYVVHQIHQAPKKTPTATVSKPRASGVDNFTGCRAVPALGFFEAADEDAEAAAFDTDDACELFGAEAESDAVDDGVAEAESAPEAEAESGSESPGSELESSPAFAPLDAAGGFTT